MHRFEEAFQVHTGWAEFEESHTPSIFRILAAIINEIRKCTEGLRIPCNDYISPETQKPLV